MLNKYVIFNYLFFFGSKILVRKTTKTKPKKKKIKINQNPNMDDFVDCVNNAHNSRILADDYKYRVMEHCVANFLEPNKHISNSHVGPWLQNLEYSTLYPVRFNNRYGRRHVFVPYYRRPFARAYRKGFRDGRRDRKK